MLLKSPWLTSQRGFVAGRLWDRSLQRLVRCPKPRAELHEERATSAKLHAAAAAGVFVKHGETSGTVKWITCRLGCNLSIRNDQKCCFLEKFTKFKLAKLWVYSFKTSETKTVLTSWIYQSKTRMVRDFISYPVVKREIRSHGHYINEEQRSYQEFPSHQIGI